MSVVLAGIAKAVGGLAAPVLDYMTERARFSHELRVKIQEVEIAKLDRKAKLISEGLTADMNWEMEFARQADRSWKDEYTLFVISIPAIGAFIPKFAPYIERGFAALDKTPHWYQLIFISLFLATYGIRFWRKTQSDT
jgi:hypothetical protein